MLLNIQFGETTYSNTPYLCSRYPENNLFTLNELIPKARSIRVAEKRPFCCKYLRPLTTLHTGPQGTAELLLTCFVPAAFLLPATSSCRPLPFARQPLPSATSFWQCKDTTLFRHHQIWRGDFEAFFAKNGESNNFGLCDMWLCDIKELP